MTNHTESCKTLRNIVFWIQRIHRSNHTKDLRSFALTRVTLRTELMSVESDGRQGGMGRVERREKCERLNRGSWARQKQDVCSAD